MIINRFSIPFLLYLLVGSLQLPVWKNGTRDVEPDKYESALPVQYNCLPEGFQLTDIVSYRQNRKGGDAHITIKDKLIEMKAQCREGKLVDGKGREIKFFKFSCYGNPPIDYEEIMEKEREKLERLQKRYTVIVLECDPRIS